MKLPILIILITCVACSGDKSEDKKQQLTPPLIHAKMVYHHYTCYECLDSEIFLFDFQSKTLDTISKMWKIQNPMNAHFSPDGTQIVFMGITPNGSWDLFLYTLGSKEQPENLTDTKDVKEEDPKYDTSGKYIVFKRNGQLAEMDLDTRKQTILTNNLSEEYSMPYYNPSRTKVVCSIGGGKESSIALLDLSNKSVRVLYYRAKVAEYYPIGINEKEFYYSAGYSENQNQDQLYIGHWDGFVPVYLPFNSPDADYSDACPVDEEWLILSSTRKGTKGGYDLYIASNKTGAIFSLNEYHKDINSSKWELGASIHSSTKKQ